MEDSNKFTPGPLTAMPKPAASFSDHGWRAIAMCGSNWMVGAPVSAVRTVVDGVVTETRWDHEANAKRLALCWSTHDDLLEALQELLPGAEAMGWNTTKARAAISKATGA